MVEGSDARETMYAPVPVRGYRPLSQTEIDAINNIKRYEEWLGKFWNEYYTLITKNYSEGPFSQPAMVHARQHFKEGFMWMTRAIARPENEW